MSLTSYRAAPPRVNVVGPQEDGAGTYSRFERDVKGLTRPFSANPLGPNMGNEEEFCTPIQGFHERASGNFYLLGSDNAMHYNPAGTHCRSSLSQGKHEEHGDE